MAFDFMKNFMMLEDEERFIGLCESIEEVLHDSDRGEKKISDYEMMQILDYVGFNLFRDDWEEFKKMEFPRDLSQGDNGKNSGKRLIN